MKRLLVLAYFYPPLAGGGVPRVLSFTRYLPEHGWACTVVCAGEHDYWVRDESLLAAVPAATEVIRVPGGSGLAAVLRLRGASTQGRRSSTGFAALRALSDWFLLPDSYAGWANRAVRAASARIAAGGIDAVLSSSPPDSVHLAAARVVRAAPRRLPWIADFRDPWIGSHFRTPPTPWHAARHAAMEASVTGGADLVLAASRTHHDALAARTQARPARLLHLPNGFEPAGATAAGPGPAPDVFRIVFTGSLSLMEDAGTLLTAVQQMLRDEPAVRSRLRVDLAGPYDSVWAARIAALGLGDVVHLPGPLAHADARTLQGAADVLMLWKPHGEGFRTMVPGKLYEYLDSGRPIVALLRADDEAAQLVQRAGGELSPPADAGALAARLLARWRRWQAGERTVARRPEWLDQHRRGALAGVLARSLDALVAEARP